MFSFLKKKKIKKSDPQQSQQQSTPVTSENKENLLTRNNKQQQQQQRHQDNESGGFDYSSSVPLSTSISKKASCSPRTSSPISYDKNLTTLRPTSDQTSKIHVDVNHNHPSDKILHICDSSEPSPRDLTDITLSSLPAHKSCHVTTMSVSSPSQIAASDLNRILTSGYINGEENMGYMKRAGDHIASYTKSPHFHRPMGFSYNRTQTFSVPGTKKGMKALVTGQTKIRKIHCSVPHASPLSAQSISSTPKTLINDSTSSQQQMPNVDEEPIVLSRYSGGFIPDPAAPKKIESLDWPAPLAIQAVPELMRTHRSRSESRAESHSNRSRQHSQTTPKKHTLSSTSHSTSPYPQLISISNEQDRQQQQHTTDDITITSENLNDDDEDDTADGDLRHDSQLEKDIDMMSKLKDASGMAHALLEDLRLQEKIIARQLPLDPWKASRSPSAAVEPPRRCRFESPTFASPSRRVHTHSSSTTNADDSLAGLSTSISTTPAGGKRVTLPRYNQQILRPGYGLTPSPKAQTLPISLDMQRSCDLDSTDLGITNSYYSHDGYQNKSTKTVGVGDGGGDHQYLNSQHAHSTRSAPILMGNPKLYTYEELKIMSKKRLPSDVDRDRLECHLSDNEFYTLFQMTRSNFYRLPEWRRVDLKKRFKLF
ncbi:unnamed protein product [Rotaria magnacalcarata]|uniref:HP domain-containing protein n=3 Tax=Rotaria magnacalcarata TaxID=392030 RepID=A0A815EGK4_9BILA|nr:unnamed protein product [Rotaria magnacalcarata]CAF1455949.1 unnamed protein product [Rotaria magnacalcarata]CAF2034546.1 unnamed protein product [Rotaria magnacalcarata]CAF2120853.1 unnamed protein product [Rotaria magnacalcarata]CAF2132719.1 unnamed protein product [Rotaria magnacalcarata]